MERVDIGESIRELATALRVPIGLTVDPGADAGERWVAVVGLDGFGAGPTPVAAVNSALGAWYSSDELRARLAGIRAQIVADLAS